MVLKKAGVVVLLLLALVALAIAGLFLPDVLADVATLGVPRILTRFLGLYGFFFLGVATLTTPFLAEVTVSFGKPFKKIHHTFSALGITLITLHPVSNAISHLSLAVFVPRFDSWEIFFRNAGRPALIILYVAIVAAFLMKKIPKYWRPFHGLMYMVLLFGIIHANLIGDDFQNIGIMLILNALFAASMVGLAFKRYRNFQIKRNWRQAEKIKEPQTK